uniref:Uncharacterized protein n=1 Tax=Ursus americanus TaxID=9643 RepID=A0A452QTC2_URSAM
MTTFDHQNSENMKLFSAFSGSSDRDSLTVHSRPRQKKPHGVSNGSPVCTSKLTKSLPASPSTSDFCQTRSCASEHRYWSVGGLCTCLSHCWRCTAEGELACLSCQRRWWLWRGI